MTRMHKKNYGISAGEKVDIDNKDSSFGLD